jgi:taurine dioxygenase
MTTFQDRPIGAAVGDATEGADPAKAESAAPRPGTDPAAGLAAQRVKLEPFNVWVGPLAHLADEGARLAELTFDHFGVERMGTTIGAEVTGIDLRRPLADEVVAELQRCLFQFKVLFFRDQPLSADEHVAFARRFGPLEVHPFIGSNSAHPELVRFEKHAGVGGYENGWHSDVSWRERPSLGAVLHALEVPPVGGDTLFADMYAAYEGLDPEVRERIDGLTAIHDYVQVFGHGVAEADRQRMRAQYPPARHPVVRTHPGTGRKLVYVNRFFVDRIEGLERDESDALVEFLSSQAEVVEYQCRFHWEQHSVAFWDNRAVQHYASSDYWPQRRVMERASIQGERPSS